MAPDSNEYAMFEGVEKGYISEAEDVNTPCTRNKVVEMLYDASGSPSVWEESPFIDYDSDAVIWAYEEGITHGNGAGHFMGDNLLTRGTAVQFVYNMYN